MDGVELEIVRLERDWMEAVRSRDAAFLEDLLGEEGGRGVHLDTPANDGTAQVFYRALGYEFAYRRPEYYDDGLDGVTFLKLFGPDAGDVAG